MTYTLAIVLAVIQGLTEFLPISSSGHLRICGALFGLSEPTTAYDVVLHVGTLIAVMVVFRRDIASIFAGFAEAMRRGRKEGWSTVWREPRTRLLILLFLAMIPTGVVGLLINHYERHLAQLWFVGMMLIINGGVLWLSNRLVTGGQKSHAEMTAGDGLLIGLAQGFGVFRGISRSGSTIMAGMALGLKPSEAFSFSFLLSIPAILAALILKMNHIASSPGLSPGMILLGGGVSVVVGYLSLLALKKIIDRGKLYYFAIYCWLLGLGCIAYGLY